MSLYWLIAAALTTAIGGFLAGVFLFKVKSRWCRVCGATLRCPDCRWWVNSRSAPAGQP